MVLYLTIWKSSFWCYRNEKDEGANPKKAMGISRHNPTAEITVTRGITTFRSTTDRIYDERPIIWCYNTIVWQLPAVLCSLGRTSRYICVMKTNVMASLSSVYFASQPLHVSGILVAHHQEVYCVYITIGTCFMYMYIYIYVHQKYVYTL